MGRPSHRGSTTLFAIVSLIVVGGCGSAEREAERAQVERPGTVPAVAEQVEPPGDTAGAPAPAPQGTGEKGAKVVPAQEGAAPGARSGVEGIATLGPVCPVVERDRPCPAKPFQAELVIREQETGREVRRFETDSGGKFRVELPAGRYILEAVTAPVVTAPQAPPVRFSVEANRFTRVDVRFDSGIR